MYVEDSPQANLSLRCEMMCRECKKIQEDQVMQAQDRLQPLTGIWRQLWELSYSSSAQDPDCAPGLG